MKSYLEFEGVGEKVASKKNKINQVLTGFLLLVFLFASNFSKISAQSVYAGEDWAVCSGDILYLADLNAELSGINGDIWWESDGDGTFQSDFLFANAVTYTPGPMDIFSGGVILTLNGREFNPNGIVFQDDVFIFIPQFVDLACNNHINFSLNANCEFNVKVDMLLEGEHPPLNLYTLEIRDQNGVIVSDNILNGTHIDQILTYSVGNICDLNTCEGTISVKDNFPPILYCDNDTITCLDDIVPDSLGFPLDTNLIDTMYLIGEKQYYLVGWDACTDATLEYEDEIFTYNCDSAFQELIVRTWTATDLHGNVSSCPDSIFVERVGIYDLNLPPSYNNIDSAALDCNGDWLALPNGNPSPESTGVPETERCHDIVFQYTDTKFVSCGNTFDVYRDWTIMDWCSQELIHWGQIIKVMDTTPPNMICVTDTVVIGTDLYNCYSKTHELLVPETTDDCGLFTFSAKVYIHGDSTNLANVTVFNNNHFVDQLPLGTHKVYFEATDECDNTNSCSYILVVVDDVIPYAICDEHTQVALSSNGIARVYATSLDDGSYDNCAIEKFEVQKMTDICDNGHDTLWLPYVDFCCEEVGDTIMVSMKITDTAGNTNICMVEVLVEDKLPPTIICPPDITVSCDYYYNPDNLEDYFGKVVTDPLLREDIIIYDYFNNGVVGTDGFAFDNCEVRIETSVEFDLNECNVGTIYRTFTAIDDGELTRSCTQEIEILDPDPFDEEDIIWPADTAFSGCLEFLTDTTITGSPIIDDDACSLVAVSFEDQLFTIVDDACEKVLRTWTIIDWCQFDHNTLAGQWTYKQVIKLYNTIEPQFTSDCSDRDICIYGSCDGLVELEASAEDDCTLEEDLVWLWRLDIDDDGIYDDFGTGSSFAEVLGQGTYRIDWTVEDLCGNQAFCSYEFTVIDCKFPTPYCISSLTTVVMNNNGMVSITPEAYDIGSYDNCTAQEDLLLSWSSDTNDTLFTVTCDSLNGVPERTFFLDLWVTDEAGNQDYCSIWLQVQDNFDVCDNGGPGGIALGGNIYLAETTQGLSQSGVDLECSLTEHSGTHNTSSNGSFVIDNLPSGENYTLEAVSNSNNYIEGVSTLDLVFIQRHILGLQQLDSPYRLLAADANNSNSISAADILEIRKVILGVSNGFQNGQSWKYLPSNHNFSNPNVPWNYPETYVYNGLAVSKMNNNFFGIKTGDVNNSYSGFLNGNLENRSNYHLLAEDLSFEKNEEVLIPVYASNFETLMGMELQIIAGNSLEIKGFRAGQLDIQANNFAIQESGTANSAKMSWNNIRDDKIDKDLALFYILTNAKGNSTVAQNISFGEKASRSNVIIDFTEYGLSIGFNERENIVASYSLLQNQPNPFDSYTNVVFEIPVAQEVVFSVFDVDGRLIYLEMEYLEEGSHTIELEGSELGGNGIYYYTLATNEYTDTKKMIYLK